MCLVGEPPHLTRWVRSSLCLDKYVPLLVHTKVCQICPTVMFGETENQRVTSVLQMQQASQATILVEMLNSPV